MRYLALIMLVALLGCEERYRYPCQDPSNWQEEQCKKPFCSANGTCPEDLTPYEKEKVGGTTGNPHMQPAPSKGDCK
jgi:hypothetical protein